MTAPPGARAHEIGMTATWAVDARAVAARLGTDAASGLTTAEAARRLALDGPNELDAVAAKPAWRLFLDQFANTMIIVLLVALVITAVIGDLKDALVIAAVVVLNALVGFTQEHRAERSLAALRRMTSPQARVRRDGAGVLLPAADVVAGDIVDLDAGALVVADGRLLEAPNLRVNEASLTGESVPADKTVEAIEDAEGALVATAGTWCFAARPSPPAAGSWSSPPPACARRWAESPPCCRRTLRRRRRSSASSTVWGPRSPTGRSPSA